MRDDSSMGAVRADCGGARLAHGWQLETAPGLPVELADDFVRPAVRAVPGALATRLKPCRIRLVGALEEPGEASRWVESVEGLEITVGCEGVEAHDVALELLVCLGQALWEALEARQAAAYLLLLCDEIAGSVPGEIDEDALDAKRRLMASRLAARSRRRLADYARASFAATAAEYVHCLWHDVTVRTGSEHLPARYLRRRLELLARWFPPDRGYRLFARKGVGAS
jgi:hypothetical protein